MKILQVAKSAVARAIGNSEVAKRDGVFVSRPVLNGQAWHDWAVKWGVPKPVPAGEMHVTVVHSVVDVKMIPDSTVASVYIGPGYGDAACFAMMGRTNSSLCVCWDDWNLWNRHWNFLSNGAVTKWPTFRPHMCLSYDAAGYELPDEALADAPIYIHLGGEVFADLKKDAEPAEVKVEADDEDIDLVVIIIDAAKSAKDLLLTDMRGIAPVDKVALRDIAAEHPVTKAVAKRLADSAWATDSLKSLAGPPAEAVEKKAPATAETRKRKEIDVTLEVAEISEEVRKNLGTEAVFKANDEEQIIYGIASVSTVKGELLEDLHGEGFTTKALREFTHDIIRGQRAGKFDHEGPACNEVVEALVLSDDMQKALGIDLGFEPLLIGMHVPDEKNWTEVKKGDWMFSIAGTMWFYEDEPDASV